MWNEPWNIINLVHARSCTFLLSSGRSHSNQADGSSSTLAIPWNPFDRFARVNNISNIELARWLDLYVSYHTAHACRHLDDARVIGNKPTLRPGAVAKTFPIQRHTGDV